MSTLKVLRNEASGVVYADSAKPALTVRFRTTSANKVLSGIPVKNFVNEIVYNDENSITLGSVTAVDALSVRLRVSGAAQSGPRLKELLLSLAAQVDNWCDESVLIGFNPTTAPVIPAV